MYDPANPSPGLNPYNQQRKLAVDAAQGAGSQGLDAITRRYAAMGNLNSGSYAKALEDNSRNTQAATENAFTNIGANEMQQSNALNEAQRQREFQEKESALQRGQQESQFGRQLGQQSSQFQQEMPIKVRQLDLEATQQQLDKRANDLNYNLGQQQQQHSGGLFGGGGFLGLGF